MAYSNIQGKVSVTKEVADQITKKAVLELQTSRAHKRARMDEIRENENLYHGIAVKSIRNPYNECFPFMAGYVDHLRSKIDDDSNLFYKHQAEADYKKSQRITAFYERESTSPAPNASWSLKHRYAKNNAIFSGVAIYKLYAESVPTYRNCLEVISHYDFHCEPRGGGILENHLFCGQDNIFKNKEDLLESPYYDSAQVKLIVSKYAENNYKDNDDYDSIRNNRFEAQKQDPVSNNYVGQEVIKFTEWYTTHKNKRYYLLFNEQTCTWIRCCLLTDMFPDNLYPYVTWHTNEDPDVFWAKAPCDDARPVARILNTMINQELYNRQKRNYGQRGYDVDMFPNVQALADFRPDGLIPVDTKNGTRAIGSGVYEFKVGDLNGTLDLVSYLDQFTGKQTGNTPASQGVTSGDKKVGVFQGEIEQVERLIGIKNKSYREALSRLGLLFQQGLEHNLTTEVSVQIMGGKGIEWEKLTPADLKTEQPLTIIPVGGTSEQLLKRAKDAEKAATLDSPAMASVNPQWKARQMLLLKGFTEEEVKEAFSANSFSQKELLSEAAQAEKDIVQGKKPKLNMGADTAFMQHIVDFAVNTNNLSREKIAELKDYALAHTDIVLQNQDRDMAEMIKRKKIAEFASLDNNIIAPESTPTMPVNTQEPTPTAPITQ